MLHCRTRLLPSGSKERPCVDYDAKRNDRYRRSFLRATSGGVAEGGAISVGLATLRFLNHVEDRVRRNVLLNLVKLLINRRFHTQLLRNLSDQSR
jgi:hypothetical protein